MFSFIIISFSLFSPPCEFRVSDGEKNALAHYIDPNTPQE
jgi:hypothetical protein